MLGKRRFVSVGQAALAWDAGASRHTVRQEARQGAMENNRPRPDLRRPAPRPHSVRKIHIAATTSLRFLRAYALTTVRFGLALMMIGCPVAGLRPSRSLVAGFSTFLIFSRPGKVTMPGPFLPSWSWMYLPNSSKTADTCLRLNSVASARCWNMALFVAGLFPFFMCCVLCVTMK